MNKKYLRHLFRDMFLLLGGIIVAVLLVRMGIITQFIELTSGLQVFSSFVAGMFFTSVITIAPASIALVALSATVDPLVISFWGAFGALLVDYFLITFFRNDISVDMKGIFKPSLRRRVLSLFHHGFLKWLVIISGALIIASPLPDEIGLAFLGFSHVKTKWLLLIIFSMNFAGIWVLTSIAHVLL